MSVLIFRNRLPLKFNWVLNAHQRIVNQQFYSENQRFISFSLTSNSKFFSRTSTRFPYIQQRRLQSATTNNAPSKVTMEIKEATTDEEILACWDTVLSLRPHLKYDEFLTRVRQQQTENYHLLYIRDPADNKVKSILGFRTMNLLYSGKTVYVDDLATLEDGRGRGYGGALIRWIQKYAKENGFEHLSLDSGYTRFDAHRQYLKTGFCMTCHHFSMPIKN